MATEQQVRELAVAMKAMGVPTRRTTWLDELPKVAVKEKCFLWWRWVFGAFAPASALCSRPAQRC